MLIHGLDLCSWVSADLREILEDGRKNEGPVYKLDDFMTLSESCFLPAILKQNNYQTQSNIEHRTVHHKNRRFSPNICAEVDDKVITYLCAHNPYSTSPYISICLSKGF